MIETKASKQTIKKGQSLLAFLVAAVLLLTGCSYTKESTLAIAPDDPLGIRWQLQQRSSALQSIPIQGEGSALSQKGEGTQQAELQESSIPLATPEGAAQQTEGASQESGNAQQFDGTEQESGNTQQPDGTEQAQQQEEAARLEEERKLQEEAKQQQIEELKKEYPMAVAILDEIGWDLEAAYQWCVKISYFSGTPIDSGLGVTWFANLGFETSRGNCYTYAATMTVFAQLLGYDAKQVDGHITGYEELHHSWVEIIVDGELLTIDPEFEWERSKSGFLKPYGAEGIWDLDQEEKQYMQEEPAKESQEALTAAGWPAQGPYEQFIKDWEYQIWLNNQGNSDPNAGCIGEDVPLN